MSPDRSVTLTGVRVEADGPEGVVVLLDGVDLTLTAPRLAQAGFRADRVRLVLSSSGPLRALPEQIRHAQAARGVRMRPWAWRLPLLVFTLKHADDVGDALAARGVE